MPPNSTTRDPELDMTFTPDMAANAGFSLVGQSTQYITGLNIYARKRLSSVHYVVTDKHIVITLTSRPDVVKYLATRRAGGKPQ